MSAFHLSDKEIFIFDAFGTLFTTLPVDKALEDIVGESAALLLQTWRKKQLEYTWLRNQMGEYTSFDQVTKEALEFAMKLTKVNDSRVLDLLLPIYDRPGLIKGAKETVAILKNKNKKVCILSNGTEKMLQNGIEKTDIDSIIDHVFSVDAIGIYKPRPEVYQMALDQLVEAKDKVVFFSSNQWDVSGASTFGLDCVWVNQYNETKEVLPFGNTMEFKSLSQVINEMESQTR